MKVLKDGRRQIRLYGGNGATIWLRRIGPLNCVPHELIGLEIQPPQSRGTFGIFLTPEDVADLRTALY